MEKLYSTNFSRTEDAVTFRVSPSIGFDMQIGSDLMLFFMRNPDPAGAFSDEIELLIKAKKLARIFSGYLWGSIKTNPPIWSKMTPEWIALLQIELSSPYCAFWPPITGTGVPEQFAGHCIYFPFSECFKEVKVWAQDIKICSADLEVPVLWGEEAKAEFGTKK